LFFDLRILIGPLAIQWPKEEEQTIQWPKEEEQTIQWPKEEEQTIQWPKETDVFHFPVLSSFMTYHRVCN
jgi:hypothetical protein